MNIPCRVLPHESTSGPAQMALDEALLGAVGADPGSAVLRTYGWSEPTLSLGYFQALADVEREPRWAGMAVVRRPSGGGALWHHHEITYALVIPRRHPLAHRSPDLYRAVHRAIAVAIRELDVDVIRRADRTEPPAEGLKPFLCFADRDPEDLVVGPHKVVGSAQRRRSGAVLQHGSILLRRSPRTPELPGLADLADVPDDPAWWLPALRRRLGEGLGLDPMASAVTDAERRSAAEIEATIYRAPGWLGRR